MNWIKRINRAAKSGRFTIEDKILAKEWNTCALAEIARRQTRGKTCTASSWPLRVQEKVNALGHMFYEAVSWECPNWALRVYKQIKETLTKRRRRTRWKA